MPCSIVDSDDDQLDVLERGRVPILRLAQIHDRVGNRSVVADAAGEHVLDVVPDALVHDARRQHALLDRLPQAARAADRVDRAHVMAMAAVNRLAGFEIDAERRAEQRVLDVVDGERVAREQHVDVAGANQLPEVRARRRCARAPGRRRTRSCRRPLHLRHHRRDARDADLDAPLRRNLVRHEREAEAIALLELRHRPDALDAAHDRVARPHVAQLAADRARRLR